MVRLEAKVSRKCVILPPRRRSSTLLRLRVATNKPLGRHFVVIWDPVGRYLVAQGNPGAAQGSPGEAYGGPSGAFATRSQALGLGAF